MMCHFYPGVDFLALTLHQMRGMLHRIPDVMGHERSEADAKDLMILKHQRTEYGI